MADNQPDVSTQPITTTAQPSVAPPTPVPPPVSAGAGAPPAIAAPAPSGPMSQQAPIQPSRGPAESIGQPGPGFNQPANQPANFGSVAHNIFQALAGGPKRTLDEKGNWTVTPLTKGGIARGVIAGALAGMFAGMQRGPGKYPGGPIEALGKGGEAGMVLDQRQREMEVENQKIKQDAMLKQAQIFETNSRTVLNKATASKTDFETNKDELLFNQLLVDQLDVNPLNFSDEAVHGEDELAQGIKDGKYPPGSVLGVHVGDDKDGKGLYRVVVNPDAKVTLTPQMYDLASTLHPTQFPQIHRDGSLVTDAEKRQTTTVSNILSTTAQGVGGFVQPNQWLASFQRNIDPKDPLAKSIPDKIDPKYMSAWLKAQKLLSHAHMTGEGKSFFELITADRIDPMTGAKAPILPQAVRDQIFASIGNGDSVLGQDIVKAVDRNVAAQAEGAKKASEYEESSEGRFISNYLKANNLEDTPENRNKGATQFKMISHPEYMDWGAPGAEGLSGQAYLNSLPENQRTLLTEIGTGRMTLDRIGYMLTRNPQMAAALSRAYPEFDQSKVTSYPNVRKEFTSTKPGTAGGALNSGGTAMMHLRDLKRINDENPVQVRTPGTASYNAYNNLLNTLTGELATFYQLPKTDNTIKDMSASLGALVNRDAAITRQMQSMGEKMDSYAQTWRNAAPSDAYQVAMPNVSNQALMARAEVDPEFAQSKVLVQIPGMRPDWIPGSTLKAFFQKYPNANVIIK